MPQKIRGIISMNFVYPYKSKNVSETKMIGNLPWYISHNFQTISGQDYLSIYLSCKNSSHLWSCNAQVEIRLLPREQKPGLVKTFEHVYNAKLKGYGFRQFVAKSELQPMVVSSGTYETHTIEVSIVLSNVRGVLNVQSIDFSEDQGEHNYFSDDHLSNITFIFKENEVTQKLYANKTYLALHSPVFRAMFSSNFTEQNAEQIVLADNFDEFHELLHVIYPTRKSITEENVESLIRLADKYRIAQVMLECERFLIESQKVGVVRKLIISDDLGLAKLQDYVLQNLVQIEQLTALRETEDYEKLSEAVKLELLDKMFEILKKK